MISVVIPTHNRAAVLQRCLTALALQDYPPERTEVIVVADGCTDDTLEVLHGCSLGRALRILAQQASGAAAARNLGAQGAMGDLLLFLDDDVIAAPGLLSAHVEAHEGNEELVVVGPYLLDPPREGDYLRENQYQYWHDLFAEVARPEHVPTYHDLVSGNLSMQSATFARLGGFNTAFPECGVEDWELGLRVLSAGLPIRVAQTARGRHLETTNLQRSLRKARRAGDSTLVLTELHPSVLPETPLVQARPVILRLVFDVPRTGALLAWIGERALPILRRLKLRRPWFRVFHRLYAYWFWRGVRDQVETREEWERRLGRLTLQYDTE